ncbi:hypothetical protein AGJ24_22425, partial [Cronobacter sakazakii]|nr:hypothetical protein [Cronobacter sakazakii]
VFVGRVSAPAITPHVTGFCRAGKRSAPAVTQHMTGFCRAGKRKRTRLTSISPHNGLHAQAAGATIPALNVGVNVPPTASPLKRV